MFIIAQFANKTSKLPRKADKLPKIYDDPKY